MSSTGRGGTRHPQDFYATPQWAVHRLLDRWWPWDSAPAFGAKFRIYDPCAGDGAIFRAIMSHPRWPEVAHRTEFVANELRLSCRRVLERLRDRDGAPIVSITFGNFLTIKAPKRINLILTNPPFSIAREFVDRARQIVAKTQFLLRVNFFGSKTRQAWLRETMPERTRVLPNRPCFSVNDDGIPGSDSTEYAWMQWLQLPCSRGDIEVLDLTPASVISAARREVLEKAQAMARRIRA